MSWFWGVRNIAQLVRGLQKDRTYVCCCLHDTSHEAFQAMIWKLAQDFGTQSSAGTARRQQAKNIWGWQKDMSYFRCVHDTSHEDFKRWYESWHKIDGTLLSIVWEEVWEWGPEDTKSGKDNGLWRVSGANSVAATPLPTMGWKIQILFKKL